MGAKKKAKKQAKGKKLHGMAWHFNRNCICHEIFPNIITGLHATVKYKYCRNIKKSNNIRSLSLLGDKLLIIYNAI